MPYKRKRGRHMPADERTGRGLYAALARLDLNLLLTLDALLEARSVTETADRFGVTQSAMSHRLGRLRDFFEDSLLVSAGDELVLTPKAERIRGPLRDALSGLRQAVFPAEQFNPREAERAFVLAAADLVEISLLPALLHHLTEHAPRVSIRMAGRGAVRGKALIRGEVDLAIAPGQGIVPGVGISETHGVRQRKLLTEGFAVLARKGHPRIRNGRLSLKRYLAEGHLLVAPQGQPGSVVDTQLAHDGLERHVAAQVANFLSAPYLVARTDHLLTCPTSLAQTVKDVLQLQVLEPPLDLPSTVIFLYWHERMHRDPGHQWLRDQIIGLVRDTDSDET
jgi:DNA-binding transcriptional LysR family regulator